MPTCDTSMWVKSSFRAVTSSLLWLSLYLNKTKMNQTGTLGLLGVPGSCRRTLSAARSKRKTSRTVLLLFLLTFEPSLLLHALLFATFCSFYFNFFQEVSLQDVRKEIRFCQKVKLPIIGVVENMSGFVCPSCKVTASRASEGGANAAPKQITGKKRVCVYQQFTPR